MVHTRRYAIEAAQTLLRDMEGPQLHSAACRG
jgi:hypothetical protein